MKKTIFLVLFATLLLTLLTACGSDPVLTYYVDGEVYHTDVLDEEGEIFGNIGKEPQKEGFYFGGWFYDDGTFKEPLRYTDLNKIVEEEDPHLSQNVYAKWEVVDLRFNESERTYTVVGLLDGAGSKVVIPAKYKDFPIVEIAPSAFRGNTTVTNVVIPDSVTTIGEHAFAECTALVSIKIPNSVKSVGKNAFANCLSLTRATVGTAVKELSYEMFYNCRKLTEVSLPQGMKKIGSRAFANCSALATLTLPFNTKNLGEECLLNTSVETLIFSGTQASWNKTNYASALAGSSVRKVTCLDGDLVLSEN